MSRPVITTYAWVPPFARGYVRDCRIRWALGEIGQDYELELIEGAAAREPAYRLRQPFGQVPVYRDETVEIFESGAIALHIATRWSGLLPEHPAARARATAWVFAALNSIEPWIIQYNDLGRIGADDAMREKVERSLGRRLLALEESLADKPWLDGDDFTVGDLMMISVLGGLRESDMLAAYPRLAAYVARGESRPAHAKAMADQLALYTDQPAPAGA